MTRFLVVVGLGLASLLAGIQSAHAQVAGDLSIAAFNPNDAVAATSVVEGPGIKVGEGTVIHPIFGLETGLISNVFHDDVNPRSAGVLRLMAQVGTASLSPERLTPTEGDENDGAFQYRADLRLSYDQMLSSNDVVNETGGLGVGALFRGMVNPSGRVAFGFNENFTRLIRAANFETDANVNRDINFFNLQLLYKPIDRTIGASLYYNNTIDIFEDSDQQFADRIQHKLGIHPTWRFLPQTQAYLDVSMGYFTGIGSDATKVDSYPFTGVAGLATLFTPKVTLNLQAGYTNGFYSSGPNYSGLTAGAQVGYRYSPLGRAVLAYELLYQDSVNANFFRDHVIRLTAYQGIGRLVAIAQPEIHLRHYEGITVVQGPPGRDDLIIALIAGVDYNFRNWIAATLHYNFSTVQTDYMYMFNGLTDDPSYVRHELLLGVRVAM